MITLLVGHRGIGKSSFLDRLKIYFAEAGVRVLLFDLDREVEQVVGRSIEQIFADQGEAAFRKLERETLQTLCDRIDPQMRLPVYIAVGAGFQGPFPDEAQVLWLRRETDRDGRIFFDRPPLNATVSPFDEYLQRFSKREYFYQNTCDEQLLLLEGYDQPNLFEPLFIGLKGENLGGFLTLFDRDLRKFSGAESFLARRLHWGVARFEIRDDLLDDALLRYVMSLVPKDRLLLTFRRETKSLLHSVIDSTAFFDWPMEKGTCPFPKPPIVSLHTREASLQDTLLRFEEKAPNGSHLKLAVPINTLQELWDAHSWWLESPSTRSFLPVSEDGCWRWYRTLFGRQMKVSFFREGTGSGLDQPYFAEWARARKHFTRFAAVLGDPAHHSFSPFEHEAFFATYHMPFVAIPLEDRGDFQFHIEILRKMGLLAVAVTSPYKERAFAICSELQRRAEQVKSVNTLLYDDKAGVWKGGNTDFDGLLAVRDLYPELESGQNGVIWGGGGTQAMIKAVLPEAQRYSAREGQPVIGDHAVDNPKSLIWAVGRNRQKECQWPPPNWRPQWVIDLNYTMDSPGREYAIQVGARHISGLTMFQTQARAQQRFWIEQKL
jgi:shikimate 5-dehydrogenase